MSTFDYRPGAEHLEPSRSQVVRQQQQQQQTHQQLRATARIVTEAAAQPAHGCLDEDFVEEYERWDGMA